MKAGDAYYKMNKFSEAEKNYTLATSVYEKFKKEADIDVASIAEAYFKLGEISYQSFSKVKLVLKMKS